jgi:hypothetical protein
VPYLSGQYLIDPAGPNFHYVWPAAIFFPLCAMLATCYAYFTAEANSKRAPITRMAQRVQGIAWAIAVVGLAIIGLRKGDAAIPFVQSRLAMYIVALCFVGLAGYVVWWVRFELPKLNAAYEATLLRRHYQPRSRRRR